MKNKIKVYLQYPWKFPDSSYYKNFMTFPPKNIDYINNNQKKFDLINSKNKFIFSNKIKSVLRNGLLSINLSPINTHLTKTKEKYDLIHCAHCLSLNNSPWVMDLESSWQLFVSGKKDERSIIKIKKILLNKNCKKIMPWTEKTKEELIELFSEKEIKNKLKVVHHAIKIQKIKRIKHDGINLLFTARYFYEKGGLETLEVFDYLTKRYKNINAFFISNTPKEIIKKYSQNKNIIFCNLMSQEELFNNIYSKTDIIIYPGYSDSYGFLFIEAASFGIPIITLEGNARKELVLDKKTGFIGIKPIINWKNSIPNIKNREEIINNLIHNTEKLIKDKNLRIKMSKNARTFAISKFSIEKRNKQLERIYQEAIK